MNLLHSLSFRLALLYVTLFIVSAAALGGLSYLTLIREPLENVRTGLGTEGRLLEAVYRQQGESGLARALERRASTPSPCAPYHLLLDAKGRAVTTNLRSWPHGVVGDWIRIDADVDNEGNEVEHEAFVHAIRFDDGSRMLIGRDIKDLDNLQEELTDALYWILPALVPISLAGGAFMSRAIGRRIDSVTTAARGVIAGDLSKRVPVSGAGDDFDRLGETLNLMLERLEQAIESVRRVSDNVAHELRTPLTHLRASLAELERGGGRVAICEAVQEAERLQTIFNAVLRISRIETSQPPHAVERVDLADILHDAAELYQPEAEHRRHRLALDIQPGLWVEGDRDLLFQAVTNLLDNAVKFTPDGGAIAVRGSITDDGVQITVGDSGPGIPCDLRERVTERFFRTPEAVGVPGLGLGLALVSATATYHRSRLNFLSADPGLRVEWDFPSPSADDPANGSDTRSLSP